jgi:RNA polymerase sigma-70 factor (ECF subfamily)
MSINGLLDILFRRHRKELLLFASQRAGDAAEDLVQESFLRLMQHPQPHTIENPRAYLYKLTANSVVDHHRKMAVREKYHEYQEDFDNLPSATPGPEITVHHAQLLQQCLKALDTLPVMQRNIFLLHRFDGMSYPEIAKLLRISHATVERHFAAAIEHCFAAALQSKK